VKIVVILILVLAAAVGGVLFARKNKDKVEAGVAVDKKVIDRMKKK